MATYKSVNSLSLTLSPPIGIVTLPNAEQPPFKVNILTADVLARCETQCLATTLIMLTRELYRKHNLGMCFVERWLKNDAATECLETECLVDRVPSDRVPNGPSA